MKINTHEFNEYLGGLSHDDPAVRRKSMGGLANYSSAEWEGTPDEAQAAIAALSGKDMNGRALTVNEAKPREAGRGGSGGAGGGRRY